jgi:hypothetical protein
MTAYGIPDVQVETFNVLLSYPISRQLSIVDPITQSWNASLQEDPVDGVCSFPRHFHYIHIYLRNK